MPAYEIDRYLRAREHFTVDDPAACWVWTGAKDHAGYGKFGISKRSSTGKPMVVPQKAHRMLYELLVEPIPPGMVLDHRCFNRACVNPMHMEPITQSENSRRRHARTTHCYRGHRLPEGERRCRECAAGR